MSSPGSPNPNRPPSSSSSSSSKSKICHFYLNHKCNRGSSCPDFHKGRGPPRGSASKKQICPHHLKGKCVYGTECSRSHGQPSNDTPRSPTKGKSRAGNGTTTSSGSKLKPKPSQVESDEARTKGKAKATEEVGKQSEGETVIKSNASGDKGVCVFYSMGTCFNDPCEFTHEDPSQEGHSKKLDHPTPPKPKPKSRTEPSIDVKQTSKSAKTPNPPKDFPAPAGSWADDVQAEEDGPREEEEDEEPITAGRSGWDRPADDDDEGSDGQWGYKGRGWGGEEPDEEDDGVEDQVDEQLQEENIEIEEEDLEVTGHEEQYQQPEGTGLNGNGWPAPSSFSASVPPSPAPAQAAQIPELAQPTQPIPAASPAPSVVSAPSVQGVISPQALQAAQLTMATTFSQPTQPTELQNLYAMQQQQQQQLAATQMQMQMQQPFMQMPGMMPGMSGIPMGSQIPGMPGMPQMAGMPMGSQIPGMPQMPMGMQGIPGMPMSFPLNQPFIMPTAQPQPTSYMDLIPEAPLTMHWSEYADPFADAQKPFCKLHAQGRCTQGQLCMYRHALTVPNYMMLYGETQPTLKRLVYGSAQVPITFPTTIIATQVQPQIVASPTIIAPPAPVVAAAPVTAPPPEQVPSPAPAPKSKSARPSTFELECKFYPIGKCKNGDRCPYQHTQHPPERTDETHDQNGNYDRDGENWSFTTKPPKINAPCRYHVEKGYCNSGEDCRFMHDQNVNTNGSSGPSGPQSIVGTDFERESADTGPTTNNEGNGWSAWGNGGGNGTSGWDEPVQEENNEGGGNTEWGAPTDQSGWGVSTSSQTTANPRRGGRDWMSGKDSGSGWGSNDSGGSRYRSGPSRSRGICYRFQEGRCTRGDTCRFSHDAPSESPANATENPQGTGWGAPKQEEPDQGTQEESGWGTASLKEPAATDATIANVQDSKDLGEQEQVPGPNHENIDPAEKQEELMYEELHSGQEVEAEVENEPNEVEPEAPNSQEETNRASELQPAIKHNDTKDHNGWADEWSTPQEISSLPFIKRKVACMAFGQGFCSRGEDCSMMHIGSEVGPPGTSSKRGFLDDSRPTSPLQDHEVSGESEVAPEVELEPLVFEHPEVKRHIDSASVTFGPDATPLSVQTVADMSRFRVFNLPVGTTMEELSKLVSPYDGKVRQDDLSGMQDGASFQIDFADSIDARQAFEFFTQQDFLGRDVIASHPKWRIRRPRERITIRVSWPKPSDLGWVHYSTVTKAKDEAKRLDGVVLNGRRLKTTYCPPKKSQKDNFAVKFANLAAGTTDAALKEICQGCNLAVIQKAIRYDEDPYEKVEEELARFGEHVPDQPPDVDYSAISTLFATFRAESFASDVANTLNGEKYAFLDNAALTVELVHFARYRLPRLLYEAIQDSITLIQEKGEGTYKLQVDIGRMNIVTMFLSSTSKNFESFAAANAELNYLLQGEIISWGHDLTWNDYFDTEKSGEILTVRIQPMTNGFIHRDTRGKVIRHFGSKETRAASKEAVLKLVKKFEDSRYETEVPRGNMRYLINGGFDDLLKEFGANKLSFDVFGCKITVRGSTEDLSKVSDFLQTSGTSSTSLYKRGCCELCHWEPQYPITLTCRHVYCSSCLKAAIKVAGQAPLHCVASHPEHNLCGTTIDYVLVKQALGSKAEEDQFLQESFFDYIRRGLDFFFCPSIDCKRVYRAGNDGFNIYCSWCNSELCSFCRSFAHIGKTCMDMKDCS
ncbi:hypothetical protein CPB83DRAFT_562882 [Crepidotus variabilis]|uniref:Uncharacterized protein n=1 Tax=Crepidotus variabilis TaxID=179855 RepID=A0A9P6JLB1_9AGAR|nr:hypothetical protein CPB83DRAFT_562882 [Crepidotus variabilis]